MIIVLVGLMNSGKTLLMTRELYMDYLKGRTIYVNYPVNFPHKLINFDYLIKMALEQPNLNNVSIGFDELWIWLDSRKSMSIENRLSSYFFNQSSKDDTKIYLTAQKNQQNESRIRNNLHKLIQCQRILKIDGKTYFPSDEKRDLGEKYNKYLYIRGVYFKQRNLGLHTEMVYQKTVDIKAKKYFKLYSTFKKMKTKQLNKTKMLVEK